MEKNRKVELTSMLGKGSRVEGTFDVRGGVRIDGEVEGSLRTDNILTVGPNGRIKANISARECLVAGVVVGDIRVTDILELERTARVQGNISARILRIHDGAVLNGHCAMSDQVPRVDGSMVTPNLEE
jgi:cytoskeletal protein CcmA (bactofilin family)